MTDENFYEIRNCVFAFKCSAAWESLADSGEEKIRFCSECSKQVHFCENDKELTEAVKSNLCVAFEKTETGRLSEILTGLISPMLKRLE